MSFPNETIYHFRFVNSKFGLGATDEIGFDLKKICSGRVLIVTDENLVKKTDIVCRVRDSIRNEGFEVDVWSGVSAEPTRDSMENGIKVAIEGKYDCFVAVGGGSCIDTAKAMNLYSTYPADFLDYVSKPLGKGKPVPGPLKPLIAVPTTAGTGSEVTGAVVVILKEKLIKTGFSSDYLRPTFAVVDPMNTLTMPPSVTASSGVDALMHAIECLTAKPYFTRERPTSPDDRPMYQGSSLLTDALSFKAVKLIGKYLKRAYYNGYDIKARSKMMLAAHMAGLAFSNSGVHIPHVLAYSIVGKALERSFLIPHGVSVGLVGPAFLKFMAKYWPKKISRISKLIYPELEFKGGVGELAFNSLSRLLLDLDFPPGLRSLGFERNDLDSMSKEAIKMKRLLAQSPIPVNEKALLRILTDSMEF